MCARLYLLRTLPRTQRQGLISESLARQLGAISRRDQIEILFPRSFVRIHQTLKVTPAIAASVRDRLWEMSDVAEMLEAFEASRKQAA